MCAKPPVAIVCVGMAGSGKTTFMQRINSYLHSKREPPYVINLDPAVRNIPFESNIDIRDSLNYKEVMREYNLGPNGGILTSLNIFATKIDQIINILEKRTAPNPDTPKAKLIKNIVVDTPGQIEVFVWSASGSILLDSLASSFPTVIAYIIDTPRTSSTSTFMSNMLYACSILYKTKLPMILVFNKTDVKDAAFAKEWMTDFETFQDALKQEEDSGSFGGVEGSGGGLGAGSGYMGSLLNSMSLMLEEFYRHLSVVGVSSMTGKGIDEFFQAVSEKADEFDRDYKPELEKRREERQQEKQSKREKELGKLMKDMNVSESSKSRAGSERAKPAQRQHTDTLSDLEDDSTSEVEAEMIEPGEDDENEDGEGGESSTEDGLTKRYQQKLTGEVAKGGTPSNDNNFTRYLRESQMSS
ncbi:hypothetical protein N7G274_003768 [Stereocaulon virgatum]|uniref:GPN-loop GTPase n=1 Tax=Stereocaulon virgatum TaxID=373712 RepID=A0ABR4AF43_9LECA